MLDIMNNVCSDNAGHSLVNSPGRCNAPSPLESCANNPDPDVDRADDRIASRILVSSFLAIISAAFDRGDRI